MIVEHDILEQILDDDWPLSRSLSFIDSLGKDGWMTLYRHWEDGNVQLLSPDCSVLPDWKVREVFRCRNASQVMIRVRCTVKGAKRVV